MQSRRNITYAPFVLIAYLAAFLLIHFAVFAPLTVYAEAIDEKRGIVRCGGPDQPACNVCELFHTANRVVNFALFNLLVPLATIMLIISGVRMATSGGSSTDLLRAKNLLQNVLIGIFLAFAAWAIVNTILITIVRNGALGRPWNQFPGCQGSSVSGAPAGVSSAPAGVSDISGFRAGAPAPGTQSVQQFMDTHYTEDDALQILAAADIFVNNTARISLKGVSRAAINGAIDLKQRCQCEVVVTGGTEPGHTGIGLGSHAAGDKLDFRITQSLENYIIRNYSPVPRHPQCHTGNCAQDPVSGLVFVKEGVTPSNVLSISGPSSSSNAHYDVCFANCAL